MIINICPCSMVPVSGLRSPGPPAHPWLAQGGPASSLLTNGSPGPGSGFIPVSDLWLRSQSTWRSPHVISVTTPGTAQTRH